MAKPKITRLNDPANPYNVKKTKTRANTAAEESKHRAANDKPSKISPKAEVKHPKKPTIANAMMKSAQQTGQRARDARIESGVNPKKKK